MECTVVRAHCPNQNKLWSKSDILKKGYYLVIWEILWGISESVTLSIMLVTFQASINTVKYCNEVSSKRLVFSHTLFSTSECYTFHSSAIMFSVNYRVWIQRRKEIKLYFINDSCFVVLWCFQNQNVWNGMKGSVHPETFEHC